MFDLHASILKKSFLPVQLQSVTKPRKYAVGPAMLTVSAGLQEVR